MDGASGAQAHHVGERGELERALGVEGVGERAALALPDGLHAQAMLACSGRAREAVRLILEDNVLAAIGGIDGDTLLVDYLLTPDRRSRSLDGPGTNHPVVSIQENAVVDCGWGRLFFGQTFSDPGDDHPQRTLLPRIA